jgi:hypothetical protein
MSKNINNNLFNLEEKFNRCLLILKDKLLILIMLSRKKILIWRNFKINGEIVIELSNRKNLHLNSYKANVDKVIELSNRKILH